jgi:hypothetical protein
MKETPYYRSPVSSQSVMVGGATGVSASTLFTRPPVRPQPVKVVRG